MINLENVTYSYPDTTRPALERVNLRVESGSITAVIGASGAGKTTLAKILSGFIPHVDGGELTGTVTVGEQQLHTLSLAESVHEVGLVIQNPFNQISGARYTVAGEIAFGMENAGTPREEMAQRVEQVAELLRITHLLDRSPYALSGGQQQLVAIASMIVLRTPVLVMDEPTSQLDPAGTRMVFDVLSGLRDAGITVVIFEHKLELLAHHADTMHVIASRTIAASGTPAGILADPRTTEWGVGTTRFAQAGRLAQARGLLDATTAVPVTFADAVATFRRL